MASMMIDEEKWYSAWLDTPISYTAQRTPEATMKQPGCSVKSREKVGGWPKHTGKLVSFIDTLGGRCIVRGHGDAVSSKFVWEGTVQEYLATWECD